jgi:hypothetical protein
VAEISALERVLYPRTTATISASGVTVLTAAQASADLLQSTAATPAVWVFPGGGPPAVAVYNSGANSLTVETAVGSGSAVSLAAGTAYIVEFDGGLVRARAVDLRALGFTLPLSTAQGGVGGGGTLTADELISIGTLPAPASSIGEGGTVTEWTIASQSTVDQRATSYLGWWGPILRFQAANQNFTFILPITGPYYRWMVWNDTDYAATLSCPVSNGGALTSGTFVMPARTRAEVAIVNQSTGDARVVKGFSLIPIAGVSAITLANANQTTLTDAQVSAANLTFSGGNQNATVLWTNAPVAGSSYLVRNTSSFGLTLGWASGPLLAPGQTAVLGYSGGTSWFFYGEAASPSGGSPIWGQLQIAVSAGFTLTYAQTCYSNIEFVTGGGVSSGFAVVWPTTLQTAGKETIVRNSTGQTCAITASGGSSTIYLQNNEAKKVYYDGTELREVRSSFATEAVLVVSGTTTYSAWDQVDADYLEFTPSGGSATVQWPNAGSLGKRGRKQTIKCDHTTSQLTVKTNGASDAKTTVLMPGETRNFIIDDAGSIVPSDTLACSSLTSLFSKTGISGVSPTVILKEYEANCRIINLQGTATGTPIIQLPDGVRAVIINNALSVGVTVKTASGTGATVNATTNKWVFIDSGGNAGVTS